MVLQSEENKGVELTGEGAETRRQKLESRNGDGRATVFSFQLAVVSP
jgi:hypothetical protein